MPSAPEPAATDPPSAAASVENGRNPWLAVIVTTLVFFLVVIDVSAVNVAFPSIRDDFDVPESTLGWIISGYNIAVGVAAARRRPLRRQPRPQTAVHPGRRDLRGRLDAQRDRAERRVLIAARVVQGIGGAIIAPTAIAVVLPDFPPNKRSTVIGLTGATGALGAVVGPALGAFLTDVWSWRGIFWINVPISRARAGAGAAPAPRVEESERHRARSISSVCRSARIGVGLVMFAIVRAEAWGIADPRVVATFVVGLAMIPVLIRRSRTHPEPLLELDLFRLRSFSSTNAGLAFYSMAFTSGFLVNSLLLQELWGESLRTTGLALVPSPLLAAFISPFAGRLADRVGHRWILTVGSACLRARLSVVPAWCSTRHPPRGPCSCRSRCSSVSGSARRSPRGRAPASPTCGPAQFGTANATVRTTQQVFYALGISVIVALLADVSSDPDVGRFRWAWVFVGTAYLASAVTVALTFPAGSSDDRAADAAAA